MPTGSLKMCACGACVERTPCPKCRASISASGKRVSSARMGYGRTWRAFRERYIAMLVEAGIPPVCGAHLPGGPETEHSRCQAEGRQTSSGLHLNHHPPLKAFERKDTRIVCDPLRIELLCPSDHSAATTHKGG